MNIFFYLPLKTNNNQMEEHQFNLPDPLSAKYKGSFGHATIKNRLPVILTKIVDSLSRSRSIVSEKYGQESTESLKDVIGALAKLKNELVTNKPILPLGNFNDEGADVKIWDDYLSLKTNMRNGSPPDWFTDDWLYVECYMYRRIQNAVENNIAKEMKPFDVFRIDKEDSFNKSKEAIVTLCKYLKETIERLTSGGAKIKELFFVMLQVALWGNKCDMSLSALKESAQKVNPIIQLESLKPYILIDNQSSVWKSLQECKPENCKIDIVLDNAGFELIGDFCFAVFLMESELANQIRFHGKKFPWFVSDVTKKDFDWTLDQIINSDNEYVKFIGQKVQKYLENNSFTYSDHTFWTGPHRFCDMKSVAPDLYTELGGANLIFFKGDLNYRKLVGDRNWPYVTTFNHALQGFHPAPLCALRTLKADVQVGLAEGQGENIGKTEPDWMETGKYAIIQFSDSKELL